MLQRTNFKSLNGCLWLLGLAIAVLVLSGCTGIRQRNYYVPYLPSEKWIPPRSFPSHLALAVSVDKSVPSREPDWYGELPATATELADEVARQLKVWLDAIGISATVVPGGRVRDPNWHEEHFYLAPTTLAIGSQEAIDRYDQSFEETKSAFVSFAAEAMRRTGTRAMLFVQLKWAPEGKEYRTIDGKKNLVYETTVHGYSRLIDSSGDTVGQ